MRSETSRQRGRRPRLVDRWRQSANQHLTPTKKALVVTWLSFTTTWGTVRVITHGIRGGWLPWGNISAGGQHLHHYNIGIATLAGIGLIAVRGDQRAIGHPAIAAAYGAGTALITDEFALLLDLSDVYWSKQGRLSIDVSLGFLSTLGAYLTAKPFWDEVARVTRHHIAHAAKQGISATT
ncbi:hypothetical protein PV410_24825 [Streptomyces sp. PA03-5A]|nr:hypothetical protein [Streptomyces sp. PA03-5A]